MRYNNIKLPKLRSIVSGLLLALTFICLGCQDKELAQKELSTSVITFALSSDDESDQPLSSSAQAVEKPLVLVSEDGTDSLTLYLSITDTADAEQAIQHEDSTATRGTSITNANLSMCSGEIALQAFYSGESFFDDVIKINDDGSASTGVARYWPATEGAQVDFWSYHPKKIANIAGFNLDNTGESISFDYSLKGTDNKFIDVKEQKDLFFAYVQQGKAQGSVKLEYSHALSAIKFVAGKALQGQIQNITLTNIVDKGKLTFTPNETTKLSWELYDSKSDINQNFEVDIDENLEGAPTQDITSDVTETTFLLIPQTIAANGHQLRVVYQRPGKTTKTYTVTLPEMMWEMGKTYTYTLKLMDGLDIEATEGSVDAAVVEGVEITNPNPNNKPCYIRAMINGNWVDEEGRVAAVFDPTEVDLKISGSNTNYVIAGNWSYYWEYNADEDIYYYKKQLPVNASTTVKLFDKFTNPKIHEDGLKLELVVLVQAVVADTGKASVKAAWGDANASIFDE